MYVFEFMHVKNVIIFLNLYLFRLALHLLLFEIFLWIRFHQYKLIVINKNCANQLSNLCRFPQRLSNVRSKESKEFLKTNFMTIWNILTVIDLYTHLYALVALFQSSAFFNLLRLSAHNWEIELEISSCLVFG